MKKALATILALVMAIGLCSVSWAANPASVNSADALQTAINDATADNNTITLTGDVALSESVTINKSGVNLVIDLGGKTISGSSQLFDIYSPVTFKNGTIDVTYNGSASICVMWLNGGAKLALENDVTVNAAKSAGATGSVFAVGFWSDCNGAELTINGKITGDNGATINGNITKNTNKISVNGTIDVNELALYLAGNGITDINNGASLKGDAGVEIRAGVLNVNGGTITSTGANYNVTSNPGGPTTTGAALAVAEHTTNQGVTVNINGGTITNVAGGKAISVANPEEKEEAKGANVSVNGGTISGDVKVGENVKSTVEGKEPLTVSGDYNMTKDSEGNYTIAKKPTSYYYYQPTTDTKTTDTKGSPKTFDAGIALYVGMALTSAAGVAFVGKKRED